MREDNWYLVPERRFIKGFLESLKRWAQQIETENESQVEIGDNFPQFNRKEIDNKMPSVLLENVSH